MSKYVAAIDQGTTSTRFMIFDHGGNVIAVDQKEHQQIYPKPGWVEHDPLEIWQADSGSDQGRVEKGKYFSEGNCCALGITNQRETTVVWEKKPASQSTMPSSGRIRGPMSIINELAQRRRAGSISDRRQACLLPPISPAQKSNGSWIM